MFKIGVILVIINFVSGLGIVFNVDYVNFVNIVKVGSFMVKIVLGYVFINYGNWDFVLVLVDIDKYYFFYNVDGIFFDEGFIDCIKISVYKFYDIWVKFKVGLGYIVLNWGVYGFECYFISIYIDNYVNFESKFIMVFVICVFCMCIR